MLSASELANRLARDAKAVCRHYLSAGRRAGNYWIVGDTGNTKGSSLFVRLTGPAHGQGARGKWQDAATGEHGDLLDLLAAREGLRGLAETLAEARRFLGNPDEAAKDGYARGTLVVARTDTSVIARRIWAEGGSGRSVSRGS